MIGSHMPGFKRWSSLYHRGLEIWQGEELRNHNNGILRENMSHIFLLTALIKIFFFCLHILAFCPFWHPIPKTYLFVNRSTYSAYILDLPLSLEWPLYFSLINDWIDCRDTSCFVFGFVILSRT